MSYNADIEKIMRKYSGKRMTRGKAIKVYCKEMCCAGDTKSWTLCTFYACPLWKFRLGRETLGNQSSFKKQGEKGEFSDKNSKPQEVLEVENEL